MVAGRLDKSLQRRIDVLDKGYVQLVNFMGDDQEIVDGARVDRDGGEIPKILDYMWRNKHTSPFEQVLFKFRTKFPIIVARQWVRHRTIRLNEFSGRYSEFQEGDYYLPDLGRFRTQDTVNRQGSTDILIEYPEVAREQIREASEAAYATYSQLLTAGVAKELARGVLPVNFYTLWVWNIDVHNLIDLLLLRVDAHAQWETQQFANAIIELVRPYIPNALRIAGLIE